MDWPATGRGMARRRQVEASVGPEQPFKGRQFTAEVILWAVRWYLMFPISYRDLELMLADRGVDVDHTTVFRWIQAYAPELEKRLCHGNRAGPEGSWVPAAFTPPASPPHATAPSPPHGRRAACGGR